MEHDPFLVDSLQNYDSSLKGKNYVNFISDTSSNVRFPKKSLIEFLVGIGVVFHHISRKALNILSQNPTSARLDLQQWQQSEHSIIV
jgi:hypothetical protein